MSERPAAARGTLSQEGPPLEAGAVSPSPRPRAELRRITIYANDDRLSVLTLRGVGFSWRCTCGARGRRSHDRAEALRNKAAHEATHL